MSGSAGEGDNKASACVQFDQAERAELDGVARRRAAAREAEPKSSRIELVAQHLEADRQALGGAAAKWPATARRRDHDRRRHGSRQRRAGVGSHAHEPRAQAVDAVLAKRPTKLLPIWPGVITSCAVGGSCARVGAQPPASPGLTSTHRPVCASLGSPAKLTLP
jgi:hypothetical protein